jgi:hypothetical protein
MRRVAAAVTDQLELMIVRRRRLDEASRGSISCRPLSSTAVPLHNDALDMKCDAREIPDPLTPVASYLGKERRELTLKDVVSAKSNQTRWMAVGRLTGRAVTAGKDAVEDVSAGPTGMAMAIVETERRLLGIVSPDDRSESAIWLAWPLDTLAVTTEGAQGMLRKRPRIVAIDAFGARLELIEVSGIRNDKSSYSTGQETACLKALGALA